MRDRRCGPASGTTDPPTRARGWLRGTRLSRWERVENGRGQARRGAMRWSPGPRPRRNARVDKAGCLPRLSSARLPSGACGCMVVGSRPLASARARPAPRRGGGGSSTTRRVCCVLCVTKACVMALCVWPWRVEGFIVVICVFSI